ncbi:MAG: hypothetical protein ITD40_05205 [Nitrosarchaeum sp.]|nr:hypothetical protein [Nitrosarchaeum sp.]
MTRAVAITLTLILIVLFLGLAGNSDQQEELREEQDYCARVKDRVHTDYNNLQSVCEERYWNLANN